jgi:hypothetical protein
MPDIFFLGSSKNTIAALLPSTINIFLSLLHTLSLALFGATMPKFDEAKLAKPCCACPETKQPRDKWWVG